ncbi:MAG: hypothetical protein JRI63_09465 [Deltaproteobacteria bacterium]|nr:hypothetical protein [Deltaproteobacteria bacterium]OQY11354.1 MAG: hypothetical protein B6I30_06995 [Desulfobacteraceae bacterium 4572_187]
MIKDIRDKAHISHEDIIELNFIRKPGAYVFRKYHKQGLRSQIMEVLDPDDVIKQNTGEITNGILFFPWAMPLKMLRIFRTRFDSLTDVFEEIRKLKIIEKYLPSDSYAKSDEFIVDYIWNGNRDFILCGLQEYVAGEILNPWETIGINQLGNLFADIRVNRPNSLKMTPERLIAKFQKRVENFIKCVKKMILETSIVPDFAGLENLIITYQGDIKLVDINNISRVSFGPEIRLDDKGYPVCDKSIEAISILEQKLLDRPIDKTETLYKIFLDPQRMKEVSVLEEKFHRSLKLRNS